MTSDARILIARRAPDGLVYLGALESPAERIRLLQENGVDVEQHLVTRPTPHARLIAQRLKRRFARASIEGCGPWFAVEYSRAIAALGEFDLETGERVASERVGLGASVDVDGAGTGRVTGFASCGRIEITVDRFKPASMVVYAPAGLVRPL
jgi:hypothetical protein